MKKLILFFICAVMIFTAVLPIFAAPPMDDDYDEYDEYDEFDDDETTAETETTSVPEPTYKVFDVSFAAEDKEITISWEYEAELFTVMLASSREELESEDFDGFYAECTECTYTFTELLEDTTYYVLVRAFAENEQIATGRVTPISTKVEAPSAIFVAGDRIALGYTPGREYSIDGETWQKSNVFTGLRASVSYVFTVRNAETGLESEPSVIETVCKHPYGFVFDDDYGIELCEICGEERPASPGDDECEHEYGEEYATLIEPSCIFEGSEAIVCEKCGAIISLRAVPMTEHLFSETYENEELDIVRHCIFCGETEIVEKHPDDPDDPDEPDEPDEPEDPQNIASVAVGSATVTAILGGGYEFGDKISLSVKGLGTNDDIVSQIGEDTYKKAKKAIEKERANNGLIFYRIEVLEHTSSYVDDFSSASVALRISTKGFVGTNFAVYEIGIDGTVTDCQAKMSGKEISFVKKTNGIYAVVDITGLEGQRGGKTSPVLIILFIVLILGFGGGAVFAGRYIYLNVKRKSSEKWLDDNPDIDSL